MTDTVKFLLVHLTIVGQVAILALLIGFFIIPRSSFGLWIKRSVSKRPVMLAMIVAWIGMMGSLFYSEIAHYNPCPMCWYQRIFMYSSAFILLAAYIRKDTAVLAYTKVLAVIGGLLAGIHYYEQLTFNPLIPCSAIGFAASCTERFVMSYGYITIPLMAFTGFLLIFLFSLKRVRNDALAIPKPKLPTKEDSR